MAREKVQEKQTSDTGCGKVKTIVPLQVAIGSDRVSEILSNKHKSRDFFWLLLLTLGALLVQGYHPFAEDAEIYLPGVEKILHPELFPVGREFFLSHASMTLFPNLIAFSLAFNPLAYGSRVVLCGIWRRFSCCSSPVGSCPVCFFQLQERGGAGCAWSQRCCRFPSPVPPFTSWMNT